MPNTAQITCKLPPEYFAIIKMLALNAGKTASQFLRDHLVASLDLPSRFTELAEHLAVPGQPIDQPPNLDDYNDDDEDDDDDGTEDDDLLDTDDCGPTGGPGDEGYIDDEEDDGDDDPDEDDDLDDPG